MKRDTKSRKKERLALPNTPRRYSTAAEANEKAKGANHDNSASPSSPKSSLDVISPLRASFSRPAANNADDGRVVVAQNDSLTTSSMSPFFQSLLRFFQFKNIQLQNH